MKTSKYWIEKLELDPHPEGGYYKETYRAHGKIYLEDRKEERNFGTAIYYLLEEKQFSRFHRLSSDEMMHFYAGGDTFLLYQISPQGELRVTKLGHDLESGEQIQGLIPAGNWFAAELQNKDSYALIGCTVAPGFDFKDFEIAGRENLTKNFPQHKEVIERLTHQS